MINAWVHERFALTALEYPIPARSNRLDFMLGALTLLALTLLGVTGIVLTQFYDPAPLGAHASVRYVITSLPLVTFVRDVHVWSATGPSFSSSLTSPPSSGGAASGGLGRACGGAACSC
jgi:ubiquinol-cytochrome c reductase cytochrome b subunit